MGLNETMARLREQAKPKPIEQTKYPQEQTELQTNEVVLNLTLDEYSFVRMALRQALKRVLYNKDLPPRYRNSQVTKMNDLLHKLKTQYNI